MCVCVCVCVCVFVCVCVCVQVCVCVVCDVCCLCVYMCMYMHGCMHLCVGMSVYSRDLRSDYTVSPPLLPCPSIASDLWSSILQEQAYGGERMVSYTAVTTPLALQLHSQLFGASRSVWLPKSEVLT